MKTTLYIKTTMLMAVLCLSATGAKTMANEEKQHQKKAEAGFFSQLDLQRPDLAAVRKAADAGDWDAAKAAWARHLKTRETPTWLWSHRDSAKIKAFLTEHGHNWDAVVNRAEGVMRREFSWEGVEKTLEKDIVWRSDDYNYEWANVLNRHGYWQNLGLAWWHTGDAKYAEDWAGMLRHWVTENPVKRGVWRGPWRSLETGIRPHVWFEVMNLFMDAPAFDAETKYHFTRSLADHARLLFDKNTKFGPGNWQQVEATGVANIGIMFPEFKEAAAWRKQAFDLLRMHMENGVFADGAHAELTPGYHRWMMMSFVKFRILAERNGYAMPELRERHEKMFEFLMHMSRPDRKYLPVGDAGAGGSIEPFMGVGALLFDRPDMRFLAADKPPADWIWMFTPEQISAYDDRKASAPTMGSQMLPHAKYGVMRTGWDENDKFLLFDCAPWGGPHSHQDRLQVVLYSGRDLLVDSGQCSYDRPLSKQYYRKSKAHNVLLIDEKEQPDSNPEVLSWNVQGRVEFASGRINPKKGKGPSHQRSVLFVKPDYWVVVDHVTGEGERKITRLFHLPDVAVEHDAKTVRTRYENGDNLWIGAADDSAIEMRKGWWRKTVTETPETPVAAVVSKQPLPAALCTVLVPHANPDAIPTVERLKTDDPDQVALRVTFKDGRTDWIAIASKKSALAAGDHKGKGVALCARTKAGKSRLDVIQIESIQEDK